MFRWRVIVAAVFAVTLVSAGRASAQPQIQSDAAVRRPFRGIFAAPAAPGAPHFLVLSGSLFAAYDVNDHQGLADDTATTPWLVRSGHYQGATVGLDYTFSKSGDRVRFGGHLGGRLNYYRRADSARLLPSNGADLSLGVALTKTLSFSARQTAAYTSNYNRSVARGLGRDLVSDISLPADDGFDLFELRAIRLASSVGLAQTFGRYTSLSGTYQLRRVEILSSNVPDAHFEDYQSQVGSIDLQYSRPMTRHATLALGYGIRASDNRRSSSGEPDLLHNINAGVNYGRALSFSRRTSLSFGTGSAIAVVDRVDTPPDDRRTRAYLIGNAALIHELGRTWTASLTYSRALRTWDELDQLYFTEAVHANLGGLVSRRLSLSTDVSWADSSLQNRGGGTHRGYAANARAHYALSGMIAVYAQYIYYHYKFSDGLALAGRYPRELDRQGVRVGLTTSVPLIR